MTKTTSSSPSGLGALLLWASTLLPGFAQAQDEDDRRPPPPPVAFEACQGKQSGPPPAVFEACDGKSKGDSCSVTVGNTSRAGKCRSGRSGRLLCLP